MKLLHLVGWFVWKHHTSFKTFVASVTVQIFNTDRKCPGCACAVLPILVACPFNPAPISMQPGHYCNIESGWKISSNDNIAICRKTVAFTQICPHATLSTTSHADWPGIETGDRKWETGETDRQPEVWHGLTLRSQTDHNWWFKCNLLPPSSRLFCTYYKTISWHSHLQEPQISNFKVYYGNQEIRKENGEQSEGDDECIEYNKPRH